MPQHAQTTMPASRNRQFWLALSERKRQSEPVYSALYQAISEDDDLFELSLEVPESQFSVRLLLSAVHYLLLKEPNQPLAAYFASIVRPARPPAGVAEALKRFCMSHRAALVDIVKSRALQTTNPDRAGALMLALHEVAKSSGEPLSLVEVGCSAGLLLLFDRYGYDFGEAGRTGDPGAEVVISTVRFTGAVPSIPTRMPTIARRVGLDLSPVEVTDPDARAWLLGCSNADQIVIFDNLRRAIDLRARTPLETIKGDALVTLPAVLQEIVGPVCVFHSRCLYQWPPQAQAALDDMLKHQSAARPLHRIGIEWAQSQPNCTRKPLEVIHTIYRERDAQTRRLGTIDGAELTWFA